MMKSKIILFDDNVLVAFKQNNIDFDEFTAQAQTKANTKRECTITPYYQMEKMVGGLSLYTLNNKAIEKFNKQVLDGDFSLVYYAVVVGELNQERGVYSACVARDKQTGLLEHVPTLNYDAVNFSFEYEVKEKLDKISLIKIKGAVTDSELLRFALADLGVPVFGDKEYKGDSLAKDTFVALSLAELRFIHPTDNSERTFVVVPEGKPWSFFNLDKWFKV